MTKSQIPNKLQLPSFKWGLFAALGYLVATIVVTWPVVFHLKSRIFAEAGDPFGTLFSLWESRTAWPGLTFPQAPFLVLATTLLARAFGEVVSFNLIQLSGFVLTGLTGYLLARRLQASVWAALFAGLVLLISPFHVSRALQHLGLANLQWLIGFLAALLWFNERPSMGRGALVGLLFAITTLDSYLYGLFGLVMLVVFGMWKFIAYFLPVILDRFASKKPDRESSRRHERFSDEEPRIQSKADSDQLDPRSGAVPLSGTFRSRMTTLGGIAVGAIVAIALIFPAVRPLIQSAAHGQPVNSTNLTPNRSLEEAGHYSAHWFAYALPSPENPLLGRLTQERYQTSLTTSGSNLTELTLYPGWITIILGAVAVVGVISRLLRRPRDPDQGAHRSGFLAVLEMTPKKRSLVWFLVLLTLVGLWLSFAPTVPLGSWQFPTLAPQLTSWFPFLRVFSRFGLLVMIGLTGLAAIGLDQILKQLKSPTLKVGLIGLVMLLSITELLIWPAQRIVAVGHEALPAAYHQIPTGSRIVEYPLLPPDEPAGEIYLLWDRLTGASLLNADPTKTASDLAALHDPRRPETIDGLIQQEVEYVTVHHELYAPSLVRKQPAATTHGTIPTITDPRATLIGHFDSIDLYRLQR